MKPLNAKNYGSIPHLPGSRLGPGDHHCHQGQSDICTVKTRDKFDLILVQQKLDGSNVGVFKDNFQLFALTRSGNLAQQSKFVHHQYFAEWVRRNYSRFDALLDNGERACGEWLALAHGTKYELPHEPFVMFDIMIKSDRKTYDELVERNEDVNFVLPNLVHRGGSCSIETAYKTACQYNNVHGAIDPIEGVVYRVERQGKVDFLAKWVRPDKVDGKYLPEVSGGDPIWYWRP